jgi:hypothetical protein
MLGPEAFTLIVAILILGFGAGVVIAGWAHRRQLGTGPASKPRRDRIADGTIKPEDVDAMLTAENARLRAHGLRALTRPELESRLVGDDRFRRRVRRLRWRRYPERARPLI